jgi:ABC-2 type transport system permease protein
MLKLRTVRGPWLLLAAAQSVVLLGAAGVLVNDEDVAAIDVAIGAAVHAGIAAIFPLVLGIMAVAGEYRHLTITDTFLGTPRRGRVIAAKLAVNGVIGAAFGVVAVLTTLAATSVWLLATGESMTWSDGDLWRTAAGAVVWNALFAVVGVGIGALVRSLPAAIAGTLAWVALVEGLVGQLVGDDVARWLPFAAGRSLGGITGQAEGGLSQWAGAAVLLAYAAVAAFAAVVSTERRDVG